MQKHVAVLMGGWSAEREVSLASGAAVSNALKKAGYRATAIDVQRDMGALMTHLYPRPDAIFNALHGCFGEDGCVQGLLNILDIPYTHSGVLASALAMNKPMAKRLFAEAGIPVAEHKIISRDDAIAGEIMDRPFVIKPLNEGSSVGVCIVRGEDGPAPFEGLEWPFGGRVMVERYIPGREFSVAVMGDKPLAVTELVTDRDFYDYKAKYEKGGAEHTVPADLAPEIYDKTMDYALAAHHALGCRGVSRSDFRFDGKGLFILEVNTQPGMTNISLAPEQARHVGMTFEEFVSWMVENAQCD